MAIYTNRVYDPTATAFVRWDTATPDTAGGSYPGPDSFGNTSDYVVEAVFGSSGASAHNALTGLTADDHTHYLLVDGTRAMTGSLDMNGNAVLNATVVVATTAISITGGTTATSPTFGLANTDAATDEQIYALRNEAGDFWLEAANDTYSATTRAFTVSRTAEVIDNIELATTTVIKSVGFASDTIKLFSLDNSTATANSGKVDWFVGDRDPNSNVTGNPGDVYVRGSAGTSSTIYQHRGAAASNSDWAEIASSVVTLQSAYQAGETINVTASDGFIAVSNSTDATNCLNIDRTFVGAGDGLNVFMGTGGEAVTGDGVQITGGSASTGTMLLVENNGTGSALLIKDGSDEVLKIAGDGKVDFVAPEDFDISNKAGTSSTIRVIGDGGLVLGATTGDINLAALAGSIFMDSAATGGIELRIGGSSTTVVEATSAGEVLLTPITGQDLTITTLGAAGDMLCTIAGQFGVGAQAAVGLTSITSTVGITSVVDDITLTASAQDIFFSALGSANLAFNQSGDTVLDQTSTGEILNGATSLVGAVNRLARGVFPSYTFDDHNLVSTTAGDWTVTATALSAADTNNAGLAVRKFDSTVDEGVGLSFYVPVGATNMTMRLVSRAETAPGGASVVKVVTFMRDIRDNLSVTSWSAGLAVGDVDIPTNETWQYDSFTYTLSGWGISAGSFSQIQLTRNAVDSGDTLDSSDWALWTVEISFS